MNQRTAALHFNPKINSPRQEQDLVFRARTRNRQRRNVAMGWHSEHHGDARYVKLHGHTVAEKRRRSAAGWRNRNSFWTEKNPVFHVRDFHDIAQQPPPSVVPLRLIVSLSCRSARSQ